MQVRLSDIIAPIIDDFKLFQVEFEQALRSEVRLINTMVRFVMRNRGKHIRPILTILSARLCGQANMNSFKAASLVEILHIATLVHDDVVDDSDLRRSWPSLRRIFNNKKAVLVGDYFLAKALSSMIGLRDFRALELLSTAAERLSSGEILQLEKALLGGMTEEVYYQMVKDKTGSLFETACELGAITTTDDESQRQALRTYGENLGIAFQIQDDLFDVVGNRREVGKPVIFDVKRNLRTLPLIYALKQLEPNEHRQYLRILKSHARRGKIASLRGVIEEGGGIAYAQQRRQHYSDKAIQALEPFPASPYKSALIDVLHFNARRTS